MPVKNTTNPSGPRGRKRMNPDDDSPSPPTSFIALWFVIGMAAAGFVCLIIGILQHGFAWRTTLEAVSTLILGIDSSRLGYWNWNGSSASLASPGACIRA